MIESFSRLGSLEVSDSPYSKLLLNIAFGTGISTAAPTGAATETHWIDQLRVRAGQLSSLALSVTWRALPSEPITSRFATFRA